jgi:hypothetical protein
MQVTEQRSPLDQALDVVLYAPVGLVVSAGEELPRWIERGRAQVSGQIGMARLVGRFAVAQGQREAGKAVRQAAQLLADLGVIPERADTEPPPAEPASGPAGAPAGVAELIDDAELPVTGDVVVDGATAVGGHPRPATATPPGHSLAIPGYDALSASQVVQRLDGLSEGELEEVRAYELATRGRRTILNKIAQLQSGSP